MSARIPLTTNFYLDEVIPPEIYSARGAKAVSLIDMRIVWGAQALRDFCVEEGYKDVSFTVNNWINGGDRDESGRRLANTRTGAKWSQHKDGRALDIKPKGITIKQLFEVLQKHKDYFIDRGWITTVEDIEVTKTWLHIDCRYTGLDHIFIFNP